MANYIGSLIQRNKYFAWRYLDPNTGKLVQVSLRTEDGIKITDKKQAVTRINQLAAELYRMNSAQTKAEYIQQIAEAKQIIHTCKVKFKDLRETFDNHPARRDGQLENKFSSLNHIVRWMSENYPHIHLLCDMTEEMAGEYLVQYWKSGISAKTYNTRLQCLKMIFRLFLKDDSPFKDYPYKQGEAESRAAFTQEQLQAIWNVLASDYQMMHKEEMIVLYFLAVYTGARCGDLCQLKWDSINFQRNILTLIPSKTKGSSGKRIEVPIAHALHEALIKAQSWKVDEYVLPNVCKRYRYNSSGISHDTSTLLEKAGIPTKETSENQHRKLRISRYGFHSFRHCYATMLINSGVNPLVVCDLMGHTTTAMTARYSHIAIDTKAQAIMELPELKLADDSQSAKKTTISLARQLPQLKLEKLKNIGIWLDNNLSDDQKQQLQTTIDRHIT